MSYIWSGVRHGVVLVLGVPLSSRALINASSLSLALARVEREEVLTMKKNLRTLWTEALNRGRVCL